MLGDYVVMGGKSAVADHVSVCSGVRLAACSGVTKHISQPGEPSRDAQRRCARRRCADTSSAHCAELAPAVHRFERAALNAWIEAALMQAEQTQQLRRAAAAFSPDGRSKQHVLNVWMAASQARVALSRAVRVLMMRGESAGFNTWAEAVREKTDHVKVILRPPEFSDDEASRTRSSQIPTSSGPLMIARGTGGFVGGSTAMEPEEVSFALGEMP